MEFLAGITSWHWLILGVILIGLEGRGEVFTPGVLVALSIAL